VQAVFRVRAKVLSYTYIFHNMEAKTKEMAGLAGNLRTVPLSDLLQLISTSGKTGMLSVKREEQKREIYFAKGNIVHASSSGSEEELLGNIILNRKSIEKSDLERALSLQKVTRKKLGTVLSEMGLISREELVEFLRFQIEEIVYRLFGWKAGDFVFYEGKMSSTDRSSVQLNTMNVIMEGTRRIDEWIHIQETLPADDVRIRVVKNPKMKSSKVTMKVEELQVLSLVDGERTVPDLLQVSPLSEFNTRKALYNLINSGLIEAGEKVVARRQKVEEEKLIFGMTVKLYSQSYLRVERMASAKLGEGARKILKRCLDRQKALNPLLSKLESPQNFLDFRHLERSLERVPDSIRFHQVMVGLNDLLLEFLKAMSRTLGSNLTRQVISEIKREVAQVVAERRSIAKQYDLEGELLKTLKKSEPCC
jgi:hypothetical protein